MSAEDLHALCQKITTQIAEDHPIFKGFDVRADAGEPGMIYVALRGAKREIAAGEELAKALESLLEPMIDMAKLNVDFAISLGRGNRDLLLQIELRQS